MDLKEQQPPMKLELAEIPPFQPKAKVPGKVTKIPSSMRLAPLSRPTPPHVPRPPPPRPPAMRPGPKPPETTVLPMAHGATPKKKSGRRWSQVLTDSLLNSIAMKRINELEEDEKNKKWYNRKGVKRRLIALGIVVFLLLSTTFLLRKEVTLEETAISLKKSQVSNRRKISAVIGIELVRDESMHDERSDQAPRTTVSNITQTPLPLRLTSLVAGPAGGERLCRPQGIEDNFCLAASSHRGHCEQDQSNDRRHNPPPALPPAAAGAYPAGHQAHEAAHAGGKQGEREA